MIRRGRNTSEFFITLLAGLGVIAGALAQVIPPGTAGTLGTVAAVAYVLSRAIAKLNDPRLNEQELKDAKLAAQLKAAANVLRAAAQAQQPPQQPPTPPAA